MRKVMGKRYLTLFAAMALAFALCVPAVAWAEQGGLATGSTVVAQADGDQEVPATSAFTTCTAKLKVNKAQGWLVENGTYYFALASDATQVMGPDGLVQAKSGAKNQAWKITFDYNSQCYTIINAKTGKALSVKGNKAKNGAVLCESDLVKKSQRLTKLSEIPSFTVPIPTQRWKLKSDKKGYYLVSAANAKMVVDFSGGRAHIAKEKKAKQHRFWFVGAEGTYAENGIGEGTFTIKSQQTGGFLNIGKSSVKQNAPAKVGTALTIWGGMFDFEYEKDGYYKLLNYNTGYALTAKGSTVYQAAYSSGLKYYQQWKPVIVGANGEVQLINRKTGQALAISGADATLVAPVASDPAQRWFINPSTTGMTTVGKTGLYRANKKKSITQHLIVIDMTAHEYFLFHKANKKQKGAPWVLEDASRCSSGAGHSGWEGTTVTSNYEGKVYGIPARYCLYIQYGSWLHSIVSYGPQGDDQLGWEVSNGCIRLPKKQAKRVFTVTKYHTTVIRYF